jgi:hypothetical protein
MRRIKMGTFTHKGKITYPSDVHYDKSVNYNNTLLLHTTPALPYNMTFSDEDGKEVGILKWGDGGGLRFTGNIEASAKRLFNFLAAQIDSSEMERLRRMESMVNRLGITTEILERGLTTASDKVKKNRKK